MSIVEILHFFFVVVVTKVSVAKGMQFINFISVELVLYFQFVNLIFIGGQRFPINLLIL